MARLRHIALSVRDPEASARFYETVFGMQRVGSETRSEGMGVYLSDGVVNLALLKLRNASETGAHHFGFIVDNPLDVEARILEAGGERVTDMGKKPSGRNAEVKYKDTEGIVFDISHGGWDGTCDR